MIICSYLLGAAVQASAGSGRRGSTSLIPPKKLTAGPILKKAIAEAIAAATALRSHGLPILAQFSADTASYQLKKLNKDKRTARWSAAPADGSDTHAIEYLYGYSGRVWDGGHPVRFRITKKTAKRIFYLRKEEDIDEHGELLDFSHIISFTNDGVVGYVNRQKLEADGNVYNNGVHWAYPDHHLYASLRGLLDRFERYRQQPKLDPREMKAALRKLKTVMAAAHPDRGGSHAAFIKARAEYEAAHKATKATGKQT